MREFAVELLTLWTKKLWAKRKPSHKPIQSSNTNGSKNHPPVPTEDDDGMKGFFMNTENYIKYGAVHDANKNPDLPFSGKNSGGKK